MCRRDDPVSLLARYIQENRKVAVVVGAGLSAASGVPVFRGDDPNAIWVKQATTMGTKAAFLRSPLSWFNDFWFPLFKHEFTRARPNPGHEALARLANISANLLVVTQNIDSLHQQTQVAWRHTEQLVEIHGRLGLYHCSSDEYCLLANETSQTALEVFGPAVAEHIEGERGAVPSTPVVVTEVPRCPECQKGYMMPLSLMFDEMYDSHAFYQSDKAMTAFEEAEALVFIGTSFQVNLPVLAIDAGPRKRGIPIFNFNIRDSLAKTGGRRYDVYNILGPAEETLQELLRQVEAGLRGSDGGRVEKDVGMGEEGAKKARNEAAGGASADENEEEKEGKNNKGQSDRKPAGDMDTPTLRSLGNPVAASASTGPKDVNSVTTSSLGADLPSPSSSTDPSYAYDTLPQPGLPRTLSEEEVEVDFRPCFGRLPHPDPEVEARVESTWAELARQRQASGCSALFNAAKFRLAGCRVVGKEVGNGHGSLRLVLEMWLTDYMTARGTNHHADVARLQADGRVTHNHSGAYLSQKMGVSALLCTAEGDLVFIRRSVKGVADFQGYIDTPGGHPEPGNLGLAFPPPACANEAPLEDETVSSVLLSRQICHEIFSSSAQEVADEVGVPLEKLGPPMLLGLVMQTEFGSLPSATFFVQCQCSTDDVHKYYASGPKEGDESTGLVVVERGELLAFLATPGLKLAPAARGSLALYVERNLS